MIKTPIIFIKHSKYITSMRESLGHILAPFIQHSFRTSRVMYENTL